MSAAQAKQRSSKAARQPSDDDEEPSVDVDALLQAERARHAIEQLTYSNEALQELAADNSALLERLRHEEQENQQVAALFRSEMAAKAQALKEAQAEVASRTAALEAVQAAAAQREAAVHAAFDQERQALVVAAGALQAQLDGMGKEAADAEIARLRAENARVREESAEKILALQHRLVELGHTDGGDGDGPSRSHRPSTGASGEESGDLCLEADLHRLLAHSRKQEDEMRLYGQEAEELQREMKALEAERASLMRNAALAEQMEAQYAKRGTLQAREIKDQKSKITTLEKGLAHMAAEFETEKAALEAGLRAQLADAAAEQNALRRLLQVRTKELRQVRRLAQEVLLQRSDVEAFLVSSIQQARTEMEAEAAAEAAPAGKLAGAGNAGALPLPPQPPGEGSQAVLGSAAHSTRSSFAGGRSASPLDRAASTASSAASSVAMGKHGVADTLSSTSEAVEFAAAVGAGPAAAAAAAVVAGAGSGTAGQVDIRQLSWQDRERILRLLFAKINRAVQRPLVPAVVRTQPLPAVQTESPPLPPLRGLATEAGPAGLA